MFFLIKWLLYFLIIIFAVYGFYSMKDTFTQTKESFVDDDEADTNLSKLYDNKNTLEKKIVEEGQHSDEKKDIEDEKLFRKKSINKDDLKLNKREKNEIMDQVRKSFQKDFSILKKNILDELDKGNRLIQNDLTYEKLFEKERIVSPKEGVVSVEAQEKKNMKEILSEKDDQIKETFIDGISDDEEEEGMYDGVTSPYCFNCSEL